MFDESKIKRDEDGKFAEKEGTKAEQQRVDELIADKKSTADKQSHNEFIEELKEEERERYKKEKIAELEKSKYKTVVVFKDENSGKYVSEYPNGSLRLTDEPIPLTKKSFNRILNYDENILTKKGIKLKEVDNLVQKDNFLIKEIDDKILALKSGYGDDVERYLFDKNKKEEENRKKIQDYYNQQEMNYKNTKVFGTTKGKLLEDVENSGIELGYITTQSGTVYDSQNIYLRNRADRIEEVIDEAFTGFKTRVDFSRASEATYIDFYENEEDEPNLKIRVGSHFKEGVSGEADIHLDYRKYTNLESFKKDLKTISRLLKK